tara:strand:- start:866 stop:1399 length:534 start_codon:yes stop_codon:yes gene_type:complete
MALTLNAADSCKFLTVGIRYTVDNSTNFVLAIEDGYGNDISGTVNPVFTLTPISPHLSYPIPVSKLAITNGIVTVILKTQTGNEVPGGKVSALLHCDIDCCLTKLTNELIECACDCAKCATSLAKAQKIFLLLKSADYAIVQANDSAESVRPGFIKDADSKYLKAKELCDASCGCDC